MWWLNPRNDKATWARPGTDCPEEFGRPDLPRLYNRPGWVRPTIQLNPSSPARASTISIIDCQKSISEPAAMKSLVEPRRFCNSRKSMIHTARTETPPLRRIIIFPSSRTKTVEVR
ncbi:interleukin-22 receptor subunit alpha-1 [Striga asiatica]|uniref:Interleukin-22 receptor subunit alpha-1 n=1 Tax=Striga asiatica TaxID=4170 RepID=A0A5A7QID3_STRAF|nr:interleukin-22 receptor subunit alpha-1 [Striga asiatica]